jgi:hypothetical protein
MGEHLKESASMLSRKQLDAVTPVYANGCGGTFVTDTASIANIGLCGNTFREKEELRAFPFRNYADSDLMTVESLRVSIPIKAKIMEDIHPEVIAMQQGQTASNVKPLTDDEARDPVSIFLSLTSILVRVKKAVK